MGRYSPPEGWTLQSFTYALEEPSADTAALFARFFGARRFAHNWAVEQITEQIDAYHSDGTECPPPSLYSLRRAWNQAKHETAVDSGTGEAWWTEISKEVFNDGIAGAVDGYWNWQKSRSGDRGGPRMGFPKRHKKNKRRDSSSICQPGRTQRSIRIVDNRRRRIPVIGEVRTHESMRKLGRLIERDMARIMSVTVKRAGGRLHAVLRVEILRPQRHHKPSQPNSRVGVDIGQRCLAVVARADGTIVERVDNPEPLKKALGELRRLNRKLARQKKGSNHYTKTKRTLNRLHHRIACIRDDALHKLTTNLAKTHSETVAEDLNVAGMRRGGAKHLRDANLGRFKHQMAYKTEWYGSTLIQADRFFPSSKTCSDCGHIQEIKSKRSWTCTECGKTHDRDENAAVNLARWKPETTGLVESRRVPALRSGEGHTPRTGVQTRTLQAAGQPREASHDATPQRGAA